MPVLLSYCATFLKPEMLHVYRQVKGILSFKHLVVTRRLENAELFPFEPVITLRKSPLRMFRRAYFRARKLPVTLDGFETRQILDLISKERVDILHAYFGTEAARMLDVIRQAPCAVVVSFHGVDLSDSLRQADFEVMLKHVDLFLARSNSLAQQLLKRGCPPDKICINSTGVPVPLTQAVQPPSHSQPLRLLQACRFIEKKGLDVSIKAVARLREQGIDARLDLAGGGPLEDSLRQLANTLGIAEQVQFLGFLDAETLLRKMANYHAFLHPSRTTASGDQEGIPNAMLEAMASGLIVFATRHSGIPEVVKHLENGVLIEHAETDELAAALQDALSKPEILPGIAACARQTIVDRYSSEANRRALEEIYLEGIARRLSKQATQLTSSSNT